MEAQRQREGRLALAIHRMTPNKAVSGYVGRTSFESREAGSKIKFNRRLMLWKVPDEPEKTCKYM